MELREYQQRGLDALEAYLRLCTVYGAKTAFIHQTERPYRAVPELPALPYICLRVPTGGGKTLMACHTLGIVAKQLLQAERAVCLWLVPSNAILDQTRDALKNRSHPYRQAIDNAFNAQVSIFSLAEALDVQHGTLAGETCVIVSTLAALRVEETEGRKVYETAGALQHHFSGLTPEQEARLERRDDGTLPYSLCNVLRLWRPVVIMDEAHNARTQLSFDTLARFSPSCVVEFTATPELEHKPEQGYFASNILAHVSAAELKAAEMVKLPIKLETKADWKLTVSEALRTQRELEAVAVQEQALTGEHIRPIVLFQAQPKNKPLTVEVLKQTLIDEFKVPAEHIAVATGQTRELEDVDLFAANCPIRFIITVQALKEGWDCSFAYVLCSVAELGAAKAVEQLLGRILRLPNAKWKQNAALNCAYAFAASARFIEAAKSLKDALVENGFERIEADDLVRPVETQVKIEDQHPLFIEAGVIVAERPDLTALTSELAARVTFDPPSGRLIVAGKLTEADRQSLEGCFQTQAAKKAIERIYHELQGRPVASATPVEPTGQVRSLRVPGLAVRVNGELELFEDSHFLEAAWKLSDQDTALSETEFPSLYVAGQSGELDVSEQGLVELRFIGEAQQQLRLMGIEPGWDLAGLTNWLDRQIPHPDISRTEATLFIHRALESLMTTRGLTVDQLAQQKYRLRPALAEKIDKHRRVKKSDTFNRMLFSTEAAEIEVGPDLCFELTEDTYSPNWYYEGRYRFQRHLFSPPMIGELKPDGEETDCAIYLDQLDGVKCWVRNLERRGDASFWLQTSTDKFYPDFVALLEDGRILVVESKGADRWSNDDSKEKRALGELWESRSNGRCLFVMPKGPDWNAIRDKIRA